MSHANNQKFLDQVNAYKKNLEDAKKFVVAVGLPQEKVGNAVYNGGKNVSEIGAIHEFGSPSRNIPSRSFLRSPIKKNEKKIEKFIAKRFKKVLEDGLDAFEAIDMVGAKVKAIITRAFKTGNDGDWQPLKKPRSGKGRVKAGSKNPLDDTGTLKRAITWITRRDK